jgi:uncharacterized protein YcbK (DUF882 family)
VKVSRTPFAMAPSVQRIILLVIIIVAIFLTQCMASETDKGRFFRAGDGKIHIRNDHSGLEIRTQVFGKDGSLREDGLRAVDRVFGFPEGEVGEHISLRLIFMLDYFSDKVAPGRVIHLVSGYRSPEYNEKLRQAGGNVASASTHRDGMALDFFIDGVDGKRLWEMIRKEECCGIGHYGGKTIHLDSGRPRFWQASTSKVATGESDFNRRMYLSTQYDRYASGERILLGLSSVSDYGFGVKKEIFLAKEGTSGGGSVAVGRIEAEGDCLPIHNRRDARTIRTLLPSGLAPGTYRIRMEFCNIPFPQMPAQILSNLIEIKGP